jgi:hypothetical protein
LMRVATPFILGTCPPQRGLTHFLIQFTQSLQQFNIFFVFYKRLVSRIEVADNRAFVKFAKADFQKIFRTRTYFKDDRVMSVKSPRIDPITLVPEGCFIDV